MLEALHLLKKWKSDLCCKVEQKKKEPNNYSRFICFRLSNLLFEQLAEGLPAGRRPVGRAEEWGRLGGIRRQLDLGRLRGSVGQLECDRRGHVLPVATVDEVVDKLLLRRTRCNRLSAAQGGLVQSCKVHDGIRVRPAGPSPA